MSTEIWQPSGEVKGLTDEYRMPRLGKIRLGVKKVSAKGNEYPSAVDYFVCPPNVTAVYGEKPRELDIVFPSDDVTAIAPVAYKMYSSTRGKVCTSDGETALRIVDEDLLGDNPEPTQQQLDRALVKADTKNWARRKIPCPAEQCRFFQDGQCKVVMNVQFMLPKVEGTGVFQLDTSSINSIKDVRGGIELVRRLAGGHIRGIPLTLAVKPTEVHPDGKKKVVQTLMVFAKEKLETIAALGEKTMHEILLPLPAGAERARMPGPHEPEDDLFTEEQRGRVVDVTPSTRASFPPTSAQATGPAPVRGGSSAVDGPPPIDQAERSRTTVEVAGSSPAPRSEISDELALAARAEELFHELTIPSKERESWRRMYKGRSARLVEFLEKQLETRKAKSS